MAISPYAVPSVMPNTSCCGRMARISARVIMGREYSHRTELPSLFVSQIGPSDLIRCKQCGGSVGVDDATVAQDIAPVGNAQCHRSILLDDQYRCALLIDRANDVKHLIDK